MLLYLQGPSTFYALSIIFISAAATGPLPSLEKKCIPEKLSMQDSFQLQFREEGIMMLTYLVENKSPQYFNLPEILGTKRREVCF